MLKRIFALGIATVAFGSLALVDANAAEPQVSQSRPIGPEVCAEQLSFESFQDACTNPEANGWQIRPPVINVTCTKRELVWLPSKTTMQMRLPTLVDIDVSLGGKKKCVDDRASFQSESVETATCFQFEQVERTYSRTILATCNDLARFSSAVELCDMTLKGMGGWAVVAQDKTGQIMNSCAGDATEVEQIPSKGEVQTQSDVPSQSDLPLENELPSKGGAQIGQNQQIFPEQVKSK
jgi:hypothetical protein